MPQQYPYSDEYMIYDKESNRYILTEKFLLDKYGVDLVEEVNERNAVNQQIAAKRALKQVSNLIYNHIHKHCINDILRDRVMFCCPSARPILQEAMGEQFYYMKMKGDLSRSTDKEKRSLMIDENANACLLKILPEVGYSLLYTGV